MARRCIFGREITCRLAATVATIVCATSAWGFQTRAELETQSDASFTHGRQLSRNTRGETLLRVTGHNLNGKTILLDPGHSLGNFAHPTQINRRVGVGNGNKACDTVGASTRDGYPEASFTLDVARRTADILTSQGAKVVLTQN